MRTLTKGLRKKEQSLRIQRKDKYKRLLARVQCRHNYLRNQFQAGEATRKQAAQMTSVKGFIRFLNTKIKRLDS